MVRRANGKIDLITKLDYKHLNKNDIEDLYLLCINGKVKDYRETGLLGSLSVFIRSSVIWERVHDFQLGMESYQQKVNLIVPTITFPSIEKKKLLTWILEMVKKYNKDVKYGYADLSPTDADVEYLEFYEEYIEDRLKHPHCLIKVGADVALKDSVTMGVPLPDVVPTVDKMNNDGFQTVVNKRKNGKTGSTSNNCSGAAAGKATWQLIKQKVRYEPKTHGNFPKNGAPKVSTSAKDDPSKKLCAKKGDPHVPTCKPSVPTSNPYDVLDDMESEKEAEVVYDENVNLKSIRTGVSPSMAPDGSKTCFILWYVGWKHLMVIWAVYSSFFTPLEFGFLDHGLLPGCKPCSNAKKEVRTSTQWRFILVHWMMTSQFLPEFCNPRKHSGVDISISDALRWANRGAGACKGSEENVICMFSCGVLDPGKLGGVEFPSVLHHVGPIEVQGHAKARKRM
ncbi:hypothetical protein Tco_0361055 [Tanacetum coccineum]